MLTASIISETDSEFSELDDWDVASSFESETGAARVVTSGSGAAAVVSSGSWTGASVVGATVVGAAVAGAAVAGAGRGLTAGAGDFAGGFAAGAFGGGLAVTFGAGRGVVRIGARLTDGSLNGNHFASFCNRSVFSSVLTASYKITIKQIRLDFQDFLVRLRETYAL